MGTKWNFSEKSSTTPFGNRGLLRIPFELIVGFVEEQIRVALEVGQKSFTETVVRDRDHNFFMMVDFKNLAAPRIRHINLA